MKTPTILIVLGLQTIKPKLPRTPVCFVLCKLLISFNLRECSQMGIFVEPILYGNSAVVFYSTRISIALKSNQLTFFVFIYKNCWLKTNFFFFLQNWDSSNRIRLRRCSRGGRLPKTRSKLGPKEANMTNDNGQEPSSTGKRKQTWPTSSWPYDCQVRQNTNFMKCECRSRLKVTLPSPRARD